MGDRDTPKTDTQPDVNAQQVAGISQTLVAIRTYVAPVEQTFHLLTLAQIETYADMGHLTQLFLMFFGLAIGAAIGFWTALRQGELSAVSNATLGTAMWVSLVVSGIFLFFAWWFYRYQRKHKRGWVTSTWRPELDSWTPKTSPTLPSPTTDNCSPARLSPRTYRRRKGGDTWHFCKNCSTWPTTDYVEQVGKPTSGEFCNACLAKDKAGNCQ